MELRILSAGAAKGIVQALQPEFLSSADAIIEGCFGAVGMIREKFDAADPCDVVILTAKMLDELDTQGSLLAGTISPLGQVETGIAVRRGDAPPSIDDSDALSASLRQAKGIYLPDPIRSTAGIHFASVLKKLGIFDELETRLRPYPNGAIAMAHLARSCDAGVIGCTQVTEILYTQGVSLVGLLPRNFGLATVYSAAVSRNAAHPELARKFIALLTGSQTKQLRTDGGFNA